MVEVLDGDHILQMTFDPKNFWTTFKSKYDTPVDLQSATNLDGGAATVLTPFDVTLPPQKVRQNQSLAQNKVFDSGFNDYPTGPSYNIEIPVYDSSNNRNFITIDLDSLVLDEIQKYYPSVLGASVELPAPLFVVIYDGEYTFDIQFNFTLKATVSASTGLHTSIADPFYGTTAGTLRYRILDTWTDWFIKIGNDPEIAFAKTQSDYSGNGPFTDQTVIFTYVDTLSIAKGTPIRVYGKTYAGLGGNFGAGDNTAFTDVLQLVLLGKDNSGIVWPFTPAGGPLEFGTQDLDSHLKIQADTTLPATVAPALLIHDIMASIVQRITGVANSFYSEFLGRLNTLARTYASNGCGSPFINIKGLQLRGYNLTDKPSAMSAKDFWLCWNPILNLGLEFKKVGGIDCIVVEEKSKFYDLSNVSIQLSNVKKIKKSYDQTFIYNKITTGYGVGKGKDASSIDDYQDTIWATALKNTGTPLDITSKGIAAGLTIEEARRTSKEQSANYQYDNNDFVIKVVEDGATFKPETTEGYNTVTNLLNWQSRYNKDITPARNLIRWLNVISIGLQNILSSAIKFVSGEGNYDIVVNKTDGCSTVSDIDVDEKGNVLPSPDYLFLPIAYDIDHYLTYAQLRAIKEHPEYAIEISQTESNYKKFFIRSLEFEQFTGNLKLVAYPKEFFDIQLVKNIPQEPEPNNDIFDPTF